MQPKITGVRHARLWATAAAAAVLSATAAHAAETADAAAAADAAAEVEATGVQEVVVTGLRTTRSAVALEATEIQKVIPGASPLKAVQTLPGVLFRTADPWGNNEQNLSLFVHGFSTQQLGFTLDGIPLGDGQYGNYNGLSPSRAISSENVARVTLSSGTGSLRVPSTSMLGGAIETFSRDPSEERNLHAGLTLGSYETNREFIRLDTGAMLGGRHARLRFLPAPGPARLGLQGPPARPSGEPEGAQRRRPRHADLLRRLADEGGAE